MYRVEAFIIPSSNNKIRHETSNEIDDVKLANKLREESFKDIDEEKETDERELAELLEELRSSNISESKRLEKFRKWHLETKEPIYEELMLAKKKLTPVKEESPRNNININASLRSNEPIYDEPFVGNITNMKGKSLNTEVSHSRWSLPSLREKYFGSAPKLPKRTTSLKVIEEIVEQYNATLEEVCYHGHKNGCSVVAKRPEDISDNVFNEHWLQRLEALRQAESVLKEKDIALQSRERLLFKKEKELRILERLLKNKLRQTEIYFQRYQNSISAENVRNLESRTSGSFDGINKDYELKISSINSQERNLESRSSGSFDGINKDYELKVSSKKSVASSLSNESDKYIRNPPNFIAPHSTIPDPSNSRCSSNYQTESNNRTSAYTFRMKQKPKMRYDDMNSTLSADVGDSSYIVTSKKFDSEAFIRPSAFRRSASERRPKSEYLSGPSRLKSVPEQAKCDHKTELVDEKVIKRVSENIISSKDIKTKYQDYGLIDDQISNRIKKVEQVENVHHKMSYLNLEPGNHISKNKNVNTRPISWCEDTDKWLQKKRQAYNMSINRMQTEDFEEKENFSRFTKSNKSTLTSKKDTAGKEKGKRFSIFR